MQKHNKKAISGMQIHNQRERESQSNLDIDKDKTKLNYDLVNDEPINYHEKINERIDSLNLKRAVRKDAVLLSNFIITSDKDFFENQIDGEMREMFFEESVEWFKNRYGKENIIYGQVHLDESTPHMHIGVVPIIEGSLSAKRLFDRNELRAIQTEFYEDVGKGFGLERGLEGSKNKHLTTQEYKVEQEEKKLENFKKISVEFKDRKKSINEVIKHKQKIPLTNNIMLPEGQYNKLVNLTYSSVKIENDLKAQIKDVEQENSDLVLMVKKSHNIIEFKEENIDDIQREKDKLEKHFDNLSKTLGNKEKEFSNLEIINENNINEKEKLKILMESLLKDRGRNLSDEEIEGRLILHDYDNDVFPETITKAEHQKSVLDYNLEHELIPKTILEKGIHLVEIIINKFKELFRIKKEKIDSKNAEIERIEKAKDSMQLNIDVKVEKALHRNLKNIDRVWKSYAEESNKFILENKNFDAVEFEKNFSIHEKNNGNLEFSYKGSFEPFEKTNRALDRQRKMERSRNRSL